MDQWFPFVREWGRRSSYSVSGSPKPSLGLYPPTRSITKDLSQQYNSICLPLLEPLLFLKSIIITNNMVQSTFATMTQLAPQAFWCKKVQMACCCCCFFFSFCRSIPPEFLQSFWAAYNRTGQIFCVFFIGVKYNGQVFNGLFWYDVQNYLDMSLYNHNRYNYLVFSLSFCIQSDMCSHMWSQMIWLRTSVGADKWFLFSMSSPSVKEAE